MNPSPLGRRWGPEWSTARGRQRGHVWPAGAGDLPLLDTPGAANFFHGPAKWLETAGLDQGFPKQIRQSHPEGAAARLPFAVEGSRGDGACHGSGQGGIQRAGVEKNRPAGVVPSARNPNGCAFAEEK